MLSNWDYIRKTHFDDTIYAPMWCQIDDWYDMLLSRANYDRTMRELPKEVLLVQ